MSQPTDDSRPAPGHRLRWASARDLPLLGELIFDAVRNGTSPYSAAQREAWMPVPPDFTDRLTVQRVALAERDDRIAGLMTLRDDGYVDLAFIRPKARGQHVFSRLHDLIEQDARLRGMAYLHCHASLMAEGPFLRCGYEVLSRERVRRGDQLLDRAEMRKTLLPGPAHDTTSRPA